MTTDTRTLVLPDEPEQDEAPAGVSGSAARQDLARRLAGATAIVAAAAFPVVEAIRTVAQRHQAGPVHGVYAALAHDAARAWQLVETLGLPAAFGTHEPGPALAYVLAPWVRALSSTPLAAESAGAVVVNGAALVAAVAVLLRRFGPAVALFAAGAIDLWLLGVGLGEVRTPEPGLVVVGPVALLVVLWCLGATGTRGAWVWSAVVASFVVQTHLPAAPFALLMVVIGGLAALLSANGDDRLEVPYHWWRSPSRTTGWIALALIWAAPVVELFSGRRTNPQALWDYVSHHRRPVGLGRAAHGMVAGITVAPLGPGDGSSFTRGTLATVVACVVLVVVAAAVLWVGGRRYSSVGRGFVGAAVLGAVLGLATLAVYPKPIGFSVAAWLAYVPLALGLGLGVALLGPLGPEPEEPPGLRKAVKKLVKKLKKRAERHSPPRPPSVGADEHEPSSKESSQAGKKAKGKAKGKLKAPAGHRRRLPLDWSEPPGWLLLPLAGLALLAAGVTVGGALGLAALH